LRSDMDTDLHGPQLDARAHLSTPLLDSRPVPSTALVQDPSRNELATASAAATAAGSAQEAAEEEDLAGTIGSGARIAGQTACSAILLGSCFLAAGLIFSEATQGARRSLYCRIGPHRRLAPVACVIPLSTAAVLCNAAVVAGLLCVARFAWRSGNLSTVGIEGFNAEVERQRMVLQADLRRWRCLSSKILFVAGATYLIVGSPCAGFARLALIFLATGFLTLYATALFFDDDFEQVRLSPRFLRFLGVYALVGLTFTTLTAGVYERLGDAKFKTDTHSGHDQDDFITRAVCTQQEEKVLAPPTCTVPLDLASTACLWWAASPLFAALLPGQSSSGSGPGASGSSAGERGPSRARRLLQRCRHRVDIGLLGTTMALLLLLDSPCRLSSPIAFSNAEFGAWVIGLLLLLRRSSPLLFDGWRGPLEHMPASQGEFTISQCVICLADLSRGEDVCRTPCGHDFHRGCLEEWVWAKRHRSAACPLCRQHLVLPENLDIWRTCG